MNSTQHPKLTIAQVRAFARAPERASAVAALLAARAFAKAERERVDAYVLPIFARYEFFADRAAKPGEAPERIADPKDLYLSGDDTLFARFLDECADAHAAHGWAGDRSFCPALVAEHAVTKAEQALLAVGAKYLGAEFAEVYDLALRDRALALLTSAIK